MRAPDEKARDGYRPNLVARWNGSKGGPVTWILSHMDIVPPGDLSLWETEQAFWELDAPIGRVCSEEVPVPYARHLEEAAIPQVAKIVTAAKAVLGRT